MESPLLKTLKYFDKYDYPLTKEELKLWSSPVSPSSVPHNTASVLRATPSYIGGGKGVVCKEGFCFLRGRQSIIKIRKQRERYSKPKWEIAHEAVKKLSGINSIEAVFVTGSLSMSNCKRNDDIDLMIITASNTLWITRLIVTLIFWNQKRQPHQRFAPDKICTNLWLDTNNLKLKTENLYIAHEILQAKCIYDKNNIHYRFLRSNSWVNKYLPNAYKNLTPNPSPYFRRGENYLLFTINYLLFLLQYLYMLPKMTSEKVGLGYAFFHPSRIKNPVDSISS